MVRAVDALNGGVRRDPDLHRTTGGQLGEPVEQEPHRPSDHRTGRFRPSRPGGGENGLQGRATERGGLVGAGVGRQAQQGALLVQYSE